MNTRKSRAPGKGSVHEKLARLDVGELHWFETTLADYAVLQRSVRVTNTRRPLATRGMEFTSKLFTAVGAGSASDIRYLVCAERVA